MNSQSLDYQSSVLTITLQDQAEKICHLCLKNSKSAKKYEKITFCHMKCWDMKHILALPTSQDICSDKKLEQIDLGKFDTLYL